MSHRWKAWICSFKYYVEGKGISDPNRCRSLMLHYLGAEIQDRFEDLEDPLEDEAPEDDDAFKKAVRMLSAQFSAKENPVYERNVLRQMRFQPGETVDQFVARLRQQARLCSFFSAAQINEEVRDKLVASLHD